MFAKYTQIVNWIRLSGYAAHVWRMPMSKLFYFSLSWFFRCIFICCRLVSILFGPFASIVVLFFFSCECVGCYYWLDYISDRGYVLLVSRFVCFIALVRLSGLCDFVGVRCTFSSKFNFEWSSYWSWCISWHSYDSLRKPYTKISHMHLHAKQQFDKLVCFPLCVCVFLFVWLCVCVIYFASVQEQIHPAYITRHIARQHKHKHSTQYDWIVVIKVDAQIRARVCVWRRKREIDKRKLQFTHIHTYFSNSNFIDSQFTSSYQELCDAKGSTQTENSSISSCKASFVQFRVIYDSRI